jgi:GNAT superfamily N-acetyltransferase
MNGTVNIRPIQPEDEAAVIELHENHYWRENCLLLNPDFYRWQFALPPDSAAAGGDQSVVAVEKGRLLSFLGVVPARASFRGRPLKAAHLITWLSAPEARGRGVGLLLMTYMAESFDFLFGRSVTPAALTIYQRLGFRYFANCNRWIGILDPDAALSLAVEPSSLSSRRVQARTIPAIDTARRINVSTALPSGAESLTARVLADSTAFDRTNDYLAWRYENHPYFDYRFLALGAPSNPDGIAVLRAEEVSGRAGRVLRVVEFIAAPAHSRQLAAAVFAYGREQNCAYADVFGMSEYFVAGFVAAGGFSTLEEPEIRLPHLLQPWDPNTDPPGLLFFGRRDVSLSATIGPADDISRIHVSKGDGNMDWPSWVPTIDGGTIAPLRKPAVARSIKT